MKSLLPYYIIFNILTYICGLNEAQWGPSFSLCNRHANISDILFPGFLLGCRINRRDF